MLPAKWRLHVAEHCALRELVAAHAEILFDHLLWSAVGHVALCLELASSNFIVAVWHDVGAAYLYAVQDCQLAVVR